MRTFVFTDDKSNKFWNIDLRGATFTVTFGKVGTKGQTQAKDFPDEAAARRAYDKLVAEKLGKGYVETTPRAAQSSPLQQALEEALAENPDDIASHSAYADYLMEQDDPRGEFIQTQLALEEPGRNPAERARLQARADELQARHARQWLGDVGRFLVGDWSGPDKPFHYEFRRGWPDLIRVLPAPDAAIAALARSAEMRLLRRLEVVYDMRYHPFDFDQFVEGLNHALRDDEGQIDAEFQAAADATAIIPPLLASPCLTNLRVFKMGFSDRTDQLAHSTMVAPFRDCDSQQLIELVGTCPRLEELYLNTNLTGVVDLFQSPALGNLRVLQWYYFGRDYLGYMQDSANPLSALVNNPSLQRLETLRLHPGRDTTITLEFLDTLLNSPNLPSLIHLQIHMTSYENEGCPRILDSGILRRLKTLDIGYGNMTDEGARLLAACLDLKYLDLLDVSRNSLTAEGIAVLEATGVRVVADNQHAEGERDYLFEVDVE